MLNSAPLHIYRASAGSGKTFLLASEYLCLLFENPYKYREILAVTFTNKATEEMKERILGELKKIATGASTPYSRIIQQRFPALQDGMALQSAADKIYRTILHDYAKFSVSTIDSFVQQVIRSFAFEIGLDAGFELQLNQDIVKEELANRLFELLESSQELLDWIRSIAIDRIETGQNWDFRSELLSLASEIFQERFYRFEENMRNLENPNAAFDALKKSMQDIVRKVEETMRNFGQQGNNIIQQAGLDASFFSGGTRSFINYFTKIQKKDYNATVTVQEARDNPNKWTTAKAAPEVKEAVASIYPALNSCLSQALDFYEEMAFSYQTAKAILRQLNNLSLLRILADQLGDYRRDNNVLLISDTQQLLRELVKDNEVPFIYEKIGNRYQHFLLDEFQDTSRFQWDNFKPLLEQSVAVGAYNLVVGDVKQSIYRWRNGDWRLLQSQVKQDIGSQQVQEASLQENYRSRASVIDFNNSLFSRIPALLQQDFSREMDQVQDPSIQERLRQNSYFTIIEDAYKDVLQEKPVSCQPGGSVDIRFFEKENSQAPSSWKPAAEARLCELIDELLLQKKLKPEQLAILTRNNADARKIISVLLEHKQKSGNSHDYKLVSSDALLISASPAIQLLLAAFRYLLNEKDDIARVELVQANAIRQQVSISEKSLYRRDINHQFSLLPPALVKEKNRISQSSLYEATELLIAIFELDAWENEQPYILAFRDLVNSFSTKGKPSIRDFIKWWKDDGQNKALPLSSASNAIQILTIHKSKGLAFDVVLMPYTDWKLKPDKGLLWCDWKDDASALDVLPVDIKSSLAETAFAYEYFEEMLMGRMDALNLLYVALTRARQGIYILAPLPSSKEDKAMTTIADLIYEGIHKTNPFIVAGELERDLSKPDKDDELLLPNTPSSLRQVSLLREPAMEEQLLRLQPTEQQKIGQLAHLVLSGISAAEELTPCLQRMQMEGSINSAQLEQVRAYVQQVFEQDQLGKWLSGSYKVLNEKAILLPGGSVRRPDKILAGEKETILLDFKFTQESSASHARQLKEYRDLLEQMGFPSVQAYVYYGYNKSLVPLKALPHQQGKLFG
jgi:ATP-dependent exoDNAse (exonuclease V) beta subunit